ncbi:hypothetical protein MTR_4g007730 [Medicago truncatula]|uniref:Uncharacterized protein n=1 Tax=Medicago truncatula TaxID=3880 RepID=A0A072UFQ0_MEDTR|nr:hypothetical protein MTR_4g007730 [Medicago truncatula]
MVESNIIPQNQLARKNKLHTYSCGPVIVISKWKVYFSAVTACIIDAVYDTS